MSPGTIRIGTSGYQYDHWQEIFYPADLAKDEWFAHYASHFPTVEINNTFYNLPDPETFEAWAGAAPEGFLYAIKASRYITHMKKLKDPEESLANLWDGVRRLGPHRGPILFQLPPNWHCNPDRLAAFLDALPEEANAVFEFRDPSWYCEEVYGLLDARGAAFCVHDLEDLASPKRARGPIAYIRFHGSEGAYRGRYGKNRLRPWARWVRSQAEDAGRDVYAYFNNDSEGHAVKDASALRDLLEDA
jgi:uncharacterized protein YecE (DUF72 family)